MYTLVIEHVDVVTQSLDADSLASRCPSLNEEPDLVLYTSSGEIGVLTQLVVSAWMDTSLSRHPKARHAFVAMGCTGWYAGILEFARSQARRAHLFLLEIPRSYTQSRLDAAGIGVGGEGLIAKESVALMVLVKKRVDELRPNDVIVNACTILAKPMGLRGTEALLLKLRGWLLAQTCNERPLDWVSFAIASSWSEQLMRGFERWVYPSVPIAEALPSVETDFDHWLTAKPVLDYLHHRERLATGRLALSCLGAGGRLGVAIIGHAISSAFTGQEKEIHAYAMGHVQWHPNLFLNDPEKPLYCAPEYRHHDNAYHLWELGCHSRQSSSSIQSSTEQTYKEKHRS